MNTSRIIILLAVLFYALPVYGGLTDGLVAYWNFDETSGDTALDSVGSANGTLYGDATRVNGISNGGVQFSGDGHMGLLNYSSLNITVDAITISLWYKPGTNEASFNSDNQMVAKWLGVSNAYILGYCDSSNDIWFGIKADNKLMAYSSVPVDNVNQWYHIVGVYNGSEQIVYINKTAGTPVANSGNIRSTTQQVRVSGYTNGTEKLNGTIDDIRIYNRALTADEVAQLYVTPEPATIFLLGAGLIFVRKKK